MDVPVAGELPAAFGRFQTMKTISGAARSIVCRAGLAAAAVLALSAATQQRAEALSLASPGTVPAAKYASEALTIEVRQGGGGAAQERLDHAARRDPLRCRRPVAGPRLRRLRRQGRQADGVAVSGRHR